MIKRLSEKIADGFGPDSGLPGGTAGKKSHKRAVRITYACMIEFVSTGMLMLRNYNFHTIGNRH